MSEGRDPAIKLFGRKIPLQEGQAWMDEGDVADSGSAAESPPPVEKDTCKEKAKIEVANKLGAPGELDPKEALNSSVLNNSAVVVEETSTESAKAVEEPQPEQDHKEADISGQDKVLKKPDKVLPCPRCNSMDTKFCYYNNYNVNQPRHFCKNCQRYWTAGGSMRNVPVGAGRRKNKHTGSGYRHTVITPDSLASVQVDVPDLIDRKPLSPFKVNGTLLKFGPDAPLCESMASILNLGEQNLASQLDFTTGAENREETSCSSACKPEENGFPEKTQQNLMNSYSNGITPLPHIQYFPGPPWASPWNPGWGNFAAAMAATGCSPELLPVQDNGILTQMSWHQPALITSAFCPPPLPFPFISPSFWGWTGGPWNLPWLGSSNVVPLSSSKSTSYCSGNVSPTLGKHSREEKTEKSLWIPKTLRIDDPDEAAKSSIFATLGIKHDEVSKFKAFSSNTGNGKGDASTTALALHANPAALSRSRSFQEIIS
ncbi:hypothetical protein IEQ34_002520 [Dendrobium chrysotoxum]|uniref:Dof-type domain-containing protein n=1 Tax=Dendrobium chrysotoxum TaxID=161865 RepID=A0AAV7HMI6_DENCH|nr:hypothetical protein IEQ34_002520 [Dendrobium chrysotoxum]